MVPACFRSAEESFSKDIHGILLQEAIRMYRESELDIFEPCVLQKHFSRWTISWIESHRLEHECFVLFAYFSAGRKMERFQCLWGTILHYPY